MSAKRHARLMERYPAVADLRRRALARMPHIACEYLESGTGDEAAVQRNIAGMAAVTLVPKLLKGALRPDTACRLLGAEYAAPFGIAPVGLAGLMWPRIECILAEAAARYSIPYCLSTVATQTPETVGPLSGDMGWFQLYAPKDRALRRDMLQRARRAGFSVLVVTADTPIPSRRERVTRAGLRMPPRITPRFVWEALRHPRWTAATLSAGLPNLRMLEKYVDAADMGTIAEFVQEKIGGTLSWEYLKEVRAEWEGPLVLKGVHHPDDAEQAVEVGCDALQVSNHGARQFDGTPAAVDLLPAVARRVRGKVPVLFDSGVRGGLDILRALALGADFVFLGRAFIYGVAALGRAGGEHVIRILLEDLQNNMVQLGCENLTHVKQAGAEHG